MLKKIAPTLFYLLLSANALAADGASDFSTGKASGNWGGFRDQLYENGLSVDILYRSDFWRNISGGAGRGNRVLDDLDIKLTLDAEKAWGMEGTTFFAYFLNNNGGRINDLAGTNGGVSNIEVPTRSFKLYEAWVQKEFYDGRFSVLAGLHDLNSEFYVTDTSGLFLGSTYGIGTEMAATGDNGPSIFPAPGLSLRLAWQPTEKTYLKTAIFDGVPGDPDRPRGTRVTFGDDDGALVVAEGGFKDETSGHFGMGVWRYTAKRPDQLNADKQRNQQGAYFLADKSVFSDKERDISAFARVGFTDGRVGQYSSNWSLGVVASGFVPYRPDGQIGLAATRAFNSSSFRKSHGSIDKSETQFEITYKDQLAPWLSLQPNVQYTVNPGTDPSAHNALTVGIRLGIDF